MINAKQHPLNNSLDKFVKDFFNEFPSTINKTVREDVLHYPPVNVVQHENDYTILMQAPGYEKADFKVKVDGNVLTISAEQKTEEISENSKMIRKEFSQKSFTRSFTLDDKIDSAGIQAKYEQGILTLNLPKKAEEKPAAQEINVQ